MRRIRIVGLCLVAAFVISAIAVTSASAEAPEYGRCLKVTPKSLSNYDGAKCTKLASEDPGTEAEKLAKGNFKWFPAFGGEKPLEKRGFTVTLKPETTITIETASGTKATCKAATSSGEITGLKTVGGISTTFSGCESGG